MRILQVTLGFPPYHIGGTDHLSYILSSRLTKKGNTEVYVFTGGLPVDSVVSQKPERFEDMQIFRVHSLVRQFLERQTPNMEVLTYKNFYYENLFEKIIREIKPDVVHFQHTIGLSVSLMHIATRYAKKTIVSLQDFWYLCPRVHLLKLAGMVCSGPEFGLNCYYCKAKSRVMQMGGSALKRKHGRIASKIPPSIKRFLKERIQKRKHHMTEKETSKILPFLIRYNYVMESLKRVDAILSPSRFLKESYVNIGKISSSSITTIPLGIVPFRIQREKSFSKPVRFGFAGSPSRHKGSQLLFEVFKRIQPENGSLVIWGKGWRERSKDFKDIQNIVFKGEYTHKIIDKVFSSFDVLIIPSILGETFSFVAHEAFFAKVPVIASDIGVFPDIIQDGKNGFLFQTNNGDALYNCIKKIIEHPELINKLSKNIKRPKTADEYVNEIYHFYRKILK